MKRRQSIDKPKPNTDLANQLKARLFDKGFSYGTLPSVKRQIKNYNQPPSSKNTALIVAMGRAQANNRIIKEQSTIFKKPNLQQITSRKVEKAQIPLIREDLSIQKEQNSVTLSRIPSAGKMRPNSKNNPLVELRASKSTYKLLSNTGQQFFRQPPFVQTLAPLKGIQRVQTAKSNANEGQMRRTRVLMDKISGKQLLQKKQRQQTIEQSRVHLQTIQSEKMIKIVHQTQADDIVLRPIKQLDRYIQLVLKNVAYIDQFIYLKKSRNYEIDPYDLEVIDYGTLKKEEKEGLKEYFTISKKGLCSYYENNPKEFILLHNWLEERNSFDRIKSLNFFKKFRKWKTLKMWHKILMKQKIETYSQLLKDKLFYLNENLRPTLLSIRQKIVHLEDLRILNYGSQGSYNSETSYELQNFSKMQKHNRNKVKQAIKYCSNTCREIVKAGFKKSVEILRAQNKNNFSGKASGPQPIPKKAQKSYGPNSKQAAYEKLQFPDNMNYEMRSRLRNQCMKFLRFSYLIDFLAMHSLKNIYSSSLDQFKSFLRGKTQQSQVFLLKQNLKQIKSFIQPLFNVQLKYDLMPIRPLQKQKIEPFMLPPTGTNIIADFKVLAHVNLRGPKKDKGVKALENDSQWEDCTIFELSVPPPLCNKWLRIQPDAESHYIEINHYLQQGLQALSNFERWSKHEDMKIYTDILEQWDDKISEQVQADQKSLRPAEWVDNNANQASKNQLKYLLQSSFMSVTTYLHQIFERFLVMHWQNMQINYDYFTNQNLSDPSDSIQYALQHLAYQKDQFTRQLPYLMDKQILRVNAYSLKNLLQPKPNEILNKIYLSIPPQIKKRAVQIGKYLGESIRALKTSTANVSDFVKQMKSLKAIDKKLPKIKEKISLIGQIINILEGLKSHIQGLDKESSKTWKGYQTQLLQDMISLQNSMSKAEQGAQKNMIRFAEQVSKQLIPALNKQITKMESLIQEKRFLILESDLDKTINDLENFDQMTKKCEFDAKQYAQYEITLNMSETRFQNLEQLRNNLNLRLDMWKGLRDWSILSKAWLSTSFEQIDVEAIKGYCQKYTRMVSKCVKKLPPNPVVQKLRKLVTQFTAAMPVVIALSNKVVQEDQQYWSQIQRIVGSKFVIDKNFKLQDLIDRQLYIYQNQIIEIATLAKQQQILKVQIQENKVRWLKLEFITKQYKPDDPRNKESFVLDKVDELYAELDQLLANFSSILGNRYLKRQRNQAQDLQKIIYNAMLIIDDWLVVQKNWIYLETIFGSGDIKTKLREQAAKFENIDKSFKKHMSATARTKLVFKNLGSHESWIRYKDTLSQIQKQLEKYLEEKRNQFPRFYFLSNDQLIQILAKANQLDSIQKNIRKCFESISKIIFVEQSRYIQSLLSLQGEIFKLNKTNVNVKGQIENWLRLLENAIDETLRKYVAKGYMEYQQSKNRVQFIKTHLSQITLVVCQVFWTIDTENCLQSNLDQYYKLLLKQLSQLTALIRDPTLPIQLRKTLIALITQDVHNRDIVEGLMQNQGSISKGDFIWSQQLRMYMQGENIEAYVVAKQINAEISYGYQYLGVMSRLVITPLTDRCWMTIIGAINIKLGAAPAGPAGTGKTESTKDLAKGLGMLCIVFNCSEQIDYKMMGRLFSGLSQQGAWSCLDQFNRIDIQVLSVIAQQLLTIRVAKLRGDSTFYFIDRNINLKANCGVFITMNPGYAGRTELPDNLKVLFRSVSMMIPDYRLIAEIMLFAEGFQEAKPLSKKMVQLYKLSSQQLSQQDHYDFGMRAVKSVLVMAGALKRADKNASQDEVLIRAMKNANIPKFLKEDLPLFEALISDLFPHTEIHQAVYPELQKQLNAAAKDYGLQSVPALTKKAIQLFETFNVRFGVMIVGLTNTGKTTCTDILAKALTALRKKQHLDQNFRTIKRHVLNPKSISMGELYGQVNQMTQQWRDGLASSIMRQCVNEQDANTTNWVVFDGPVDALWIENMNTVLDDNMMLCLANGQRIKLTPAMRMLFEVMDLRVASPATVSRCGMVYMLPEDLTWKPLVNTWLDKWIPKMQALDQNDDYWTTDLRNYLMQLFQKSIDSTQKFIVKKTKEPIVTSAIQLSSSLTRLIEIICNPANDFKVGQDREYKKKFLTYSLVFSFIWSGCITATDKYHQQLSFHCRGIFEQVLYPSNDFVQNFYFQPHEIAFKHWNQKLTEFSFQKEQPFHSIIVQTIDTVRYSFVIKHLTQNLRPVLVTGPSGTGKSIQLSKVNHAPLVLTSTTSHLILQMSVESKLEKIRKNIFGAAPGTITVVAVDDANMPAQDQFGAIPAIEVLRCMIDKKGIWDRREKFWKFIQNTAFVCACSPPGGGRNQLTPRFTRHFNVLCLPQPSHNSLTRIFKEILDGFLLANQFAQVIKKSSEAVVNSTIQIYSIVKKQKLPIPSKFHYTFNLRDVSSIFQGMLQSKRSTVRDVQSLGKLWFHQSSRILKDRLNTQQDHQWLHDKMHDLLEVNFRVRKRDSKIFFSNILKLQSKQYEEIPDLRKITKVLQEIQDQHNAFSDQKLQLVFFNEAVEHILRIQRILSLSRGNGLLLGVSGSGKQSLTRLASFINNYTVRQVEITKGYNLDTFRTFLKTLMIECSAKSLSTTFLFTDNQIVDQLFLEDINNLLNSGEIPNFWELQQREQIINTTRPFNAQLKRPQSPEIIYRTFVERVRERLHIILSMSPIGDALRVRCRKFPGLVNCCTIDWFFSWPQQALMSVASAILDKYDKLPIYDSIPKRQDVIQAFSDICKEVHLSANQEARKFQATLKRKVYTTPKSYLDMLKLYLSLLQKKQNQMNQKRERLQGGLQKLQQAGIQVKNLEKNLIKLKPQLQMQNQLLAKALVQVDKDSKKAAEIEIVVAAQAQQVGKQKNEVQILADEAREKLKEVQPELQRAKKAVQTIDRKALQTIRNYPKPPSIVQTIMQGVCILFGIKGDWEVQKKLLIKLDDFITSLKQYKKDSIPEDRLLKLRNQLQKSQFKEQVIIKKVREMLQIAQWCKAIEKYATVAKQIEPKKRKMNELQFKLNEANRELQGKMAILKQAQDKVLQLQNNTKEMNTRKRDLQKQLQLTKDRLQRAKDLIVLTKDEAIRWKQTVQLMQAQIVNIPMDVFISTAAISYNGPFTGAYRKNLVDYWITVISAKDLPMSPDFQITKVLGDPLVIRDWMIDGLPSDTVSLQNAIFCMEGHRWPLMIDPQQQAYKWLNRSYSSSRRVLTKPSASNFVPQVKGAVKNGTPVLLTDIQQTLPAVLDSIFSKEIKSIDGMPMIKYGQQNIYYDSNFRLFLFTKISNPKFLPEIFIRVNIINFTVTFQGLEQQLLAMVVKHERQEIQAQRDDITVKMGEFSKKIKESELNILKLLKKAKSETILDNVQLIVTLKQSQQAALEIKQRIKESKKIQANIAEVRQQYSMVATRGSILFFIIKDLALIDNMYQYSLQYIEKILHIAMDQAPKGNSTEQRLTNLIEAITKDVFRNVTRGLFVKDKILFAFIIAISINRHSKVISEDSWNAFTRGAANLDKIGSKPNPSKNLFSQRAWDLAQYLEAFFPKFTGITTSISSKLKLWEAYVQTGKLSAPLPDEWDRKLDNFDKILLSRVLQPQKIVNTMSYYVINTIGQQYLDPPNVTVRQLWKDSDQRTPIIFVLSPGADPTASLLKLSESSDIQMVLNIISLGQGQGGPAEKLISKSKVQGKWVLLQNCHLAKTWMPSLEKIVQQNLQPSEQIHSNFRLFLTSMPAAYFPASILQNGIKMTTQPPRGIKANLKRSWNDIDEDQLGAYPQKAETLHKLLWGLTFFHAIIQERQKFGPLGWNIRYQFNQSDLQTSKTVMSMLLGRGQGVPFEALLFVTGQINYGGRVTDDWDRRCLMTILRKFYNPHVLDRKYLFSKASEYHIPDYQNLQNYKSYIDGLPLQDSTAIFGMHPNANITYLKQQQMQIMDTLLLLQPKEAASGGKTSQDLVLQMVTSMLQKKEVPQLLSQQNAHKQLFQVNQKGLLPSLSTFLLQEMQRFNKLLRTLKSSLQDLKKAINGLILLSDELDSMFYDLLIGKVPKNWQKSSFLSLKPLGAWIKDLKLRVAFIREWLTDGGVNSYWMSAFFFPQGFLTGVLQQFARQPQKEIPIDELVFSFRFTDLTKDRCLSRAPEGIYVNGLYLQGASWDIGKRLLADPLKNQLHTLMPIVQFIPIKIDEKKPNQKVEIYECPVYKTSVRAGILSTTGQSTNFVLPIEMPSVEPADYWILQGTALLLQLNQ